MRGVSNKHCLLTFFIDVGKSSQTCLLTLFRENKILAKKSKFTSPKTGFLASRPKWALLHENVSGFCNQSRLKPVCSATETSFVIKILLMQVLLSSLSEPMLLACDISMFSSVQVPMREPRHEKALCFMLLFFVMLNSKGTVPFQMN